MTKCEYMLYDQPRRGKEWPKCGKPATHIWTPRGKSDLHAMPVCEAHGKSLSGSASDELSPIHD